MRRREFIALVGVASTAWPFAARAQQKDQIFRIGFFGASLKSRSIEEEYRTFLARLRELVFTEGQNIKVE
jgi:hypothetical protein